MKTRDIRSKFLAFFEKQKNLPHARVESSSLVPANDRSVLFSIAGMQQFKPYFLGDPNKAKKDLGLPRATSVQKCFRVVDIDEIGDSSHLTFFEMLGNFSFNDYFKDTAIELALTFITKELHVKKEKLWVTYFDGDNQSDIAPDNETKDLWIKRGIPQERIVPRGSDDNFWGPPGKTGPCGPSTEIYYPYPGKTLSSFDENALIEIWNIVFMQYAKDKKGNYTELQTKNIDTGMGLERIGLIVENKKSVFDTCVFEKINKAIINDPAFSGGEDLPDKKRLRIAADHLRASIFLLSDDVTFGKKEQQAVLRRIFRKALDQYDERNADLSSVLDSIVDEYHSTYTSLKEKRDDILKALLDEQKMYQSVRERKVEDYLKKISPHKDVFSQVENLQGSSERSLSSQEAFSLITTYGFSSDQLKKEGYEFNEKEVNGLMQRHKETSKQGAQKKFGGHGLDSIHSSDIPEEERKKITKLHTATHLLHSALRKVLGDGVSQQGSDINTERLRFDFSFPRKLTDNEKQRVEQLVNDIIKKNYEVKHETMPLQEALDQGALAFFREKYPDPVSVYTVYDPQTSEVFSKELCGGPHVKHTQEIGDFRITSEKSVAQGVRRIKATVS